LLFPFLFELGIRRNPQGNTVAKDRVTNLGLDNPLFRVGGMVGGRGDRVGTDTPEFPAFKCLDQGLLQRVTKLGSGHVLIGRKGKAKDLTLRHLAPLGVIVGDTLGFGQAGVIDDDDFVAGLGRAQRDHGT
jgi:hypothetical protein